MTAKKRRRRRYTVTLWVYADEDTLSGCNPEARASEVEDIIQYVVREIETVDADVVGVKESR